VKLRRATDIDTLARDLHHGRPYRRIGAALALGQTSDSRAEKLLLSALGDDSETVRWAVVNALIDLDPERPVGQLLRALHAAGSLPNDDELPEAEEILRLGLERVQDIPHVDLFEGSLFADNPVLRVLSARALGYSDDLRAGELLLSATEDGEPRVVEEAIRSLAKVGSTRAAARLRALTSHRSRRVRRAAKEALDRVPRVGGG
jgi:HEAT repeat protein